MSREIWRSVKGYESIYEVSNEGRVRSLDKKVLCKGKCFRIIKGIVLKPTINHEGYHRVTLYDINNKKKRHSVHRLIGYSFIPNIKNKPQINHINGIVGDNRLENLEWCTQSENQLHAYKIGLQKPLFGERNGTFKLSYGEVIIIKKLLKRKNMKQNEIADFFKVNRSVISRISNNKAWPHVQLEMS